MDLFGFICCSSVEIPCAVTTKDKVPIINVVFHSMAAAVNPCQTEVRELFSCRLNQSGVWNRTVVVVVCSDQICQSDHRDFDQMRKIVVVCGPVSGKGNIKGPYCRWR